MERGAMEVERDMASMTINAVAAAMEKNWLRRGTLRFPGWLKSHLITILQRLYRCFLPR